MAGLAELRVSGLGWSLQGKWVCPVGSYLQVWGKCARPSMETSFSSTVCAGCWALDKIATSSTYSAYADHARKTALTRSEAMAYAAHVRRLDLETAGGLHLSALDCPGLFYALGQFCKDFLVHFKFSSTSFLNAFSWSGVMFSRSFLR